MESMYIAMLAGLIAAAAASAGCAKDRQESAGLAAMEQTDEKAALVKIV